MQSGMLGLPVNLAPNYILGAVIEDQKPQNVGGGTFTNGPRRTRDFNTLVYNTIGVSLSANQILVPPGNYIFRWVAPAYEVQRNRSWLRDITKNVDILRSASVYCGAGSLSEASGQTGVVHFTEPTRLEVQHQGALSVGSIGFGVETNTDIEVYSRMWIWKERN